MKIKVIIVMISLATATVFVSGGYGYWQKELTISGTITVVPKLEEPAVLVELNTLENIIELEDEIKPNDNASEVNSNLADSQSDEPLPDAPDSTAMNPQELEQVEEQGEEVIKTEAVERVDATKATEQVVPNEQEKAIEQPNEEQALSNADNESSASMNITQTEAEERVW